MRYRMAVLAALLAGVIGCGKSSEVISPPIVRKDKPANPVRKTGPVLTNVTLPAKHDKTKPLPAMVLLHGMGSAPEGFLAKQWQIWADKFSVAVIAVSAPIYQKPDEYDWSDDPAENAEAIAAALTIAEGKTGINRAKVILMGYSQGAFAALNLGLAYPDRFIAAIALSPGSLTDPSVPPAANGTMWSTHQTFILCFGVQDEPKWIQQAKDRMAEAKKRGAKTEIKEYPNEGHLIPPDLNDLLPGWLAGMDKAAGTK